MHYYQRNISDYMSHTLHLDDSEDLAFTRMLDLYYLHESPLPEDVKEIAKLIRMRTHCESIANVLREYFELQDDGYHNKRADNEISAYQAKSEKAKASAKARWDKKPNKTNKIKDDANALRTECEGNAKHKTLNKKHKPSNKGFTPPSQIEVEEYFRERGSPLPIQQAESFINFYSSKGWMVGKNKMKDWKASVRGWMSRDNNQPNKQSQMTLEQLARQVDF